jgi:hypothetical protein
MSSMRFGIAAVYVVAVGGHQRRPDANAQALPLGGNIRQYRCRPGSAPYRVRECATVRRSCESHVVRVDQASDWSVHVERRTLPSPRRRHHPKAGHTEQAVDEHSQRRVMDIIESLLVNRIDRRDLTPTISYSSRPRASKRSSRGTCA